MLTYEAVEMVREGEAEAQSAFASLNLLGYNIARHG